MSDEPKKTTEVKKKDKAEESKKNFFMEKFAEYRAEFRKIVWPSRDDLIKHTVTTIVISLLFGAFITLLDGAFSLLFTTLVSQFTA